MRGEMENTKSISYEPDGVHIIEGRLASLGKAVVNSKILKDAKSGLQKKKEQAKKKAEQIKNRTNERPIWRYAFGLVLCTLIAVKTNLVRYVFQACFRDGVISLWRAIVAMVLGIFIDGYNNNKKVK